MQIVGSALSFAANASLAEVSNSSGIPNMEPETCGTAVQKTQQLFSV